MTWRMKSFPCVVDVVQNELWILLEVGRNAKRRKGEEMKWSNLSDGWSLQDTTLPFVAYISVGSMLGSSCQCGQRKEVVTAADVAGISSESTLKSGDRVSYYRTVPVGPSTLPYYTPYAT
eukprot:scaffold936_cov106-Amphora_coffeaeformis.AAC.20